MPTPNINTYTNVYKFGRGRLLFNRLVEGIYQGFRPFGNCPGFSITVTSEKFEHFSSEEGLEEKDLEITRRITRGGTVQTDNMSNDNLELFLAADATTLTQSATPITDEVIGPVTANRSYQLGTSFAKGGIRSIASVAVRIKEGDDATTRANTTPYAVGDFYVPAAANSHFYVCTIAGTSAGSPPTFTTNGTTFADGTATFRDVGLITPANTSNADWIADTDLGFLSVTPAGAIAVSISRLPSGSSLRLNVDYTPSAVSRVQIATSAAVSLRGELKWIATDPYGDKQDAFFPDVTLSPDGELPFVTGDAVASATFTVGVNKLNSTTSAIYIDGRPAAE